MTKTESNSYTETALTFSGILITAVIGGLGALSMLDSPVFVYVLVLAILLLAFFIVALRLESGNGMLLVFWLQALCIGALLFLVPDSFMLILTIVLLVQAVELFGMRQSVFLLFASQGLYLLAQFSQSSEADWLQILFSVPVYGMLQVFAIAVIRRAKNERQQREEMASLNRELIATRELLSQTAAQSERLRIARDLHDILGHHMTALILNLEVASHSVEGQPKEKVEQSLAMAKLLLSDLRSTVGELRDASTFNLEESIKKLVADIPNFSIEVDFSDAPQFDDVDAAETFLRCAQEAVTNVLRHSNADRCRIAMSGNSSSCTLAVSDNGKSDTAVEPGNGLKGMLERVRARGGNLAWQQNQDGLQLLITLNLSNAANAVATV
jgi:two-component system, NarL family, sensor histidine kinase DesK